MDISAAHEILRNCMNFRGMGMILKFQTMFGIEVNKEWIDLIT